LVQSVLFRVSFANLTDSRRTGGKKLTCMNAMVLVALSLMASATTQARDNYHEDIEVDVVTGDWGYCVSIRRAGKAVVWNGLM